MSQGVMNILMRRDIQSVSVTRPADTTAYTALDVIGTAVTSTLTFNMGLPKKDKVLVVGVKLRIDAAAIPAGMGNFRLHIYNTDPTAIADNAAFTVIAGDRAGYQGYITIPAPVLMGATIICQDSNVNLPCEFADGSSTLYGVLQVVDAYTPASATVYTMTLKVVGL